MKIILGMLAPLEGEIAVDGVPLRRVGVRTYRAGIDAAMQDDQLFTGSIAQNIAFFGAVEMQRVIECASLAGIHDDIHAMPMRYETLLGDLGNTLSGGQRQRILLLARALYKRPRILLFDEASSNLDVALERRVNENIHALSMTRIVIAHRPETIAFSDRVFTLTGSAAITPA
jgi:ATP-binding cassette, subfamily B, bacterial CvaB/MchF/RaxB